MKEGKISTSQVLVPSRRVTGLGRRSSVGTAMASRLWVVALVAAMLSSGCAGSGAPTVDPGTGGDGTSETVAASPNRTKAVVEPHRDWSEAVLYFVVLDRFADGDRSNNRSVDPSAKGAFHGGDLAGLTQNIDELSDLGVTAIWLTPVVDNTDGFVTGAGFPDWAYHGYWADDFNRVDRRFGTEDELRGLVDAAHDRGIKVLLDVVYNHVGYDSKWQKDPAKRRYLRIGNECGNDDVTSCLSGLPDLRTEDPELADLLMDAHLGMAERTGLDGFRLDTVKHVAHEFWQAHRERIDRELGEDFFLLGEVWGGDAKVLDSWFENDELDAGFDFGFAGSAIGFVKGRGRPVAFNAYLERRRNPRDGYHLAHYLSTHDVPGALYQLDGDMEAFRLLALLQMTVSGIPTIYYGEEVGRLGGDWPENRSAMPWGDLGVRPGAGLDRDEDLRDFYKRLIRVRRAHPALWRGSHKGVDFGPDHLVFHRKDSESDDAVLVAVNRAEEPVSVAIDTPEGWPAGSIVDALAAAVPIEFSDDKIRFELPGRSARILVPASTDPNEY